MVRLLLGHYDAAGNTLYGFNPTMVRLLLNFVQLKRKVSDSFNPTMVRLLPMTAQLSPVADAVFQSHNGAIAAQELAA